MTIVKPLRLGLLARAHRQPPKVYYFVAALGYFDLLDPSDFRLETEMWPTITPAIGTDMLDTGMPKPGGELLVAGDACAPAGETVRQCVVDVQLGAIRKRLAVFGDREWIHGDGGPVFTRPAAFARMPLTWENAFGGESVEANPTGKGARSEAALREGRRALLPNVENPDRLILEIGDKPAPIGMRPVAIDNPARMKHAGTVDDSYLREQFPGHPLNFDWAFYHAATPDQRTSGYLRGDEPIRVTGMHPDHPVISSRLPGMRVRAFLNLDKGEGDSEFREITLRCETVWLFPTLLKGVVLYRGGCEIRDIDGLDVKDTMLAYERLGETPRSIEHYLAALKERTDPETAALKFFDEKPLRPDLTAEEVAGRDAEVVEAETEEERKREKRAELAIVSAFRAAGLPLPPSAAIPKPPPLPVKVPVVTPQSLARMDVDMVGILKATKEIQTYAMGQLNAAKSQALSETSTWLTQVQQQTKGLIPAKKAAKLASAAKSVAEAMAKLAPSGVPLSDGTPVPDAAAVEEGAVTAETGIPTGEEVLAALAEGLTQDQMAALESAIAALDAEDASDGDLETEKRLARARALGLPEGALLAPARDQLDQLSPEGLAQRLSDAPEGMAMPNLQAALAAPTAPPAGAGTAELDDADAFLASLGVGVISAPPPPGGSPDAEAAMAQAGDALKKVTEASPLAAHAMAVGASVDPVPMDQAMNSARSALDEAQVQVDEGLGKVRLISPEAIFPLDEMAEPVRDDLGALVLQLAARGESLAGRDLAGANLVGADLSGLDLSGVKLEKADLSGARLTASNLQAAALTGAKLDGADLSGAVLTGANLSSVSAGGTVFAKADMRDARLMMADLTGADLSGCRLAKTQVLNAKLTGARFINADLDHLMFIQSEMRSIVLDSARLKGCIFIEIDLEGLSARGAALNKCVMVSVSAEKADFTGADLSDSALIGGVKLNGGTFRDLVAPRSGWRQASLVGADFTAARLDEADLGEVDLTDALLPRASFKRANLSAATLERADFAAANLFEAQVRRVKLGHASLRRANLFSANLDEADLAFCDITGANLNRTLFARPGRVA